MFSRGNEAQSNSGILNIRSQGWATRAFPRAFWQRGSTVCWARALVVPWDVREGSGGCVWFATSLGPPGTSHFTGFPLQATRRSAWNAGCFTSWRCRNTSSCAASARLGGCSISRASEYQLGVGGWGLPDAPAPCSAPQYPPPPRSRDFYHTCYCLSGLAIAQHFGSGDLHHEVVLGGPENRLVGCRALP